MNLFQPKVSIRPGSLIPPACAIIAHAQTAELASYHSNCRQLGPTPLNLFASNSEVVFPKIHPPAPSPRPRLFSAAPPNSTLPSQSHAPASPANPITKIPRPTTYRPLPHPINAAETSESRTRRSAPGPTGSPARS